LLATIVVLIAGTTFLWIKTDGARALTSESARRLAVSKQPRNLPSPLLEASDRKLFTLEALRGRMVVVDFIYTNCPTLCVSLGSAFSRLQASLVEASRKDIHLLSIGFDIARDTPDALATYGKHHLAGPASWTLARVVSAGDLPSFLAAFGVVVLSDGYGGFTHNAALHIVDRQGRLVRILDADDTQGVLDFIGKKQSP
jgi:protein SCO1/2